MDIQSSQEDAPCALRSQLQQPTNLCLGAPTPLMGDMAARLAHTCAALWGGGHWGNAREIFGCVIVFAIGGCFFE